MSRENKDADQLRSYCEADLRLCFRLCRLLVFPCGGSFIEYGTIHQRHRQMKNGNTGVTMAKTPNSQAFVWYILVWHQIGYNYVF